MCGAHLGVWGDGGHTATGIGGGYGLTIRLQLILRYVQVWCLGGVVHQVFPQRRQVPFLCFQVKARQQVFASARAVGYVELWQM